MRFGSKSSSCSWECMGSSFRWLERTVVQTSLQRGTGQSILSVCFVLIGTNLTDPRPLGCIAQGRVTGGATGDRVRKGPCMRDARTPAHAPRDAVKARVTQGRGDGPWGRASRARVSPLVRAPCEQVRVSTRRAIMGRVAPFARVHAP